MRTRLSGRHRFAAVRGARAHANAGNVRVHAAANGLAVARAGFALTGMRRAVDRNRVRRRLRAALRPRLGEVAGMDLVVSAGPGAATQAYQGLREDLERCVEAAVGRARRASAVVTGNGRR